MASFSPTAGSSEFTGSGSRQRICRWLIPGFVVALLASTLGIAAFVPPLASAQTGVVDGDGSFTLHEAVGPDQVADSSPFNQHFPSLDSNGLPLSLIHI